VTFNQEIRINNKLISSAMKTFLKISLIIISIFVLLFVLFLAFFTITDYKPDATSDIHNTNHPDTLMQGDTLSIITWNIGYAGLGNEMDFFYDGGEQVRTTNENTQKNLSAISDFLSNTCKPDFILLQEVDKRAKRTYLIDETKHLAELFKEYNVFFAPNYKVRFVPLPITSPMGFVHSGLLCLSNPNPAKSVRLDLPGEYSWPMRVFMLDRCILLNRYPLNNGKEFVLLDIHNSAFDDGSLKKQEMDFIRDLVIREYEKGNYIAGGGDWNQNPPGLTDNKLSKPDGYENFLLSGIDVNFLPEQWQWCFGSKVPTNRSLRTAFNKKTSGTTVLDFFLLSPNIEVVSVKTYDLAFQNSDHNPVRIKLTLNILK